MKKIEVIKMDTTTRLNCYKDELNHCNKEYRKQALESMISVCEKILSNIDLIIK